MRDWPEDRVDRLRRMFAAGCSDAEIGLACGVSVPAVIGKRQRLDLFRAARHGDSAHGDAYGNAIRRAERERRKERTD